MSEYSKEDEELTVAIIVSNGTKLITSVKLSAPESEGANLVHKTLEHLALTLGMPHIIEDYSKFRVGLIRLVSNERVKAIKALRQVTREGLKESKELVDDVTRNKTGEPIFLDKEFNGTQAREARAVLSKQFKVVLLEESKIS